MSAPTLRRGTLGTADIAFFVVSAAAPLTVMAGVAPIALLLGGIGAPVGYLVAGVTLAIFA
ncbi:amino acid transporter, partial [Streptomyces cavourensis]